ncbi:MAG: hypothetical protein PWP04_749 [Candidatus Atribacteria bacterium]|nr:hypothetical protein [Candidatus Atribacteria bacterium]
MKLSKPALLLVTMVGFLILAITLAAGAQELSNLSLEEAVEMGLERSSQAQVARQELESARIAFEEGQANLLLQPSVIQELALQNSWKLAQINYRMSQSELALSIEEAYYNVLRAQQGLELAHNNLERVNNQYQNIETKYSLGMVAEIDLLSAALEVDRAQSEIQTAERGLSLAWFQLNRLIGNQEEKVYNLSTKMNFEPQAIDLEKGLEYALSHRLEIEQARDNVILKQKEVEVNSTPYTPPLTLQKSKVELAQAQANLENVQNSVILEVRQKYSNLKDAEAQVPLQVQSSKIAQEKLRVAQARFDAGVITAIDLLDEQYNTYQAETTHLQAIFDYQIAQATFFTSLGMTLEERGKWGQETQEAVEESPSSQEPEESPEVE